MTNEYQSLIERLRRVVRRYTLISVLEIAAAVFLAAWCLFFAAAVFESIGYLAPAVKTIIVGGIGIVSLAIGLFHGWRRFGGRPDIEGAARMVERIHPGLGDRLISTVQLGGVGDLRGQSGALVDALVTRAASETADIDFRAAVSTRPLRRLIRLAYGAVIVTLASAILFPGAIGSGWYRLARFSRPYVKPDRTVIYPLTGDAAVIRGDDFTADGFLAGNIGRPLDIVYRWNGGDAWTVRPAEVDPATGDFSVTVERPQESFEYYLDAGSAETRRYAVTVIERPVVEEIAVELSYPDYTGRDTLRRNDNDGNIRALAGAGATVRIRANKPLGSMTVLWSDSTETTGTVTGASGTFSFTVDDDIDYRLALRDTLGIGNADPITYRVTGLADEPPSAAILSPTAESVLPLSMVAPVHYVAADDYGLGGVELVYALPYESDWRRDVLNGDDAGTRIEDVYEWDMTNLDLLPGDTVDYFLEAHDNDVVNGPKYGRSDTLAVRMPSTTDLMRDLQAEQSENVERLREYTDGETVRDLSLEEVERNIINRNELDWTDRNALEKNREYLESMRDDMKQMSTAIDDVAEKLSEDDMAALETIEKYRRISDLMDEIAEGELKTALEQITRAQVDIDPRNLKEDLDQFKASAEKLQEKLDRIVNLLEQVKALQRHDTAKRLLEQLASDQAELAAQYRDNPENGALERKQRNLASEMEKLEAEIEESADDLADIFNVNNDKIKDYMDRNSIPGTMENAAGSMQEGDTDSAEQYHAEANMQLSELLEQMDELSNAVNSNTTEEMRKRLFAAVSKLLAVSDMQERLIGRVDGMTARPDSALDAETVSRIQMESVDALRNAKRSVNEFTNQMEQLVGPLENVLTVAETYMTQAVDAYAGGNVDIGRPQSERALRSVNIAAHFMVSLLDSQEGQRGGGMPGDMLQQLQQIANGEMSINSMMDSADGDMMMRLAAEQQKLAQMLSELGRKVMDDQRLREMLEGITGDMDDTAGMMSRNEDRELIERRQLDIYRRLLDARRSRREKEEPDNRRESRTAELDAAEGAEQLAPGLGEGRLNLNERIRQAMEEDFSPEYKRLIREYFESLMRAGEEAEP